MMENFDNDNVTVDLQPTVGQYDLVAKITSSDLGHLNEAIEDIHMNDKVRSTKVLLGTALVAEAA